MAPISITAEKFRSLSRSARIARLSQSRLQIRLPTRRDWTKGRIKFYTLHLRCTREYLQRVQTTKFDDEDNKFLEISRRLYTLLTRLHSWTLPYDTLKIPNRDAWAYPSLVYTKLERARSFRVARRYYRKFFGSVELRQFLAMGRSDKFELALEARRLLRCQQKSHSRSKGSSIESDRETVSGEGLEEHEMTTDEESETDVDTNLGHAVVEQISLPSRNAAASEDDALGEMRSVLT